MSRPVWPEPPHRTQTRGIHKENPLKTQLDFRLAHRWAQRTAKQHAYSFGRALVPVALMFLASSAARAQGSIDMSGATTIMTTFKTFAMYAGAVICLGGLIFAGIRMMGGRFQEAIPGLFGALFGAGVLGWGAGWISSLTGQTL